MKLSKRLQAIFNMVPHGVAADVGSDHGKLIISLYEKKIITRGYAIENKIGPYHRLLQAIEEHGLIDYVIPLLSDGISDLPISVNTVIIAGMGGNNIIKILKAHPHKLKNVKTIIVDAHNAIPEVRKEITNMGYVIADEDIVNEDGIYYEIIKFIKGDIAILNEPDIEFGPKLRNEKSLVFIEKYQSRLLEIEKLLKRDLPENRVNKLLKEKERIESVL